MLCFEKVGYLEIFLSPLQSPCNAMGCRPGGGGGFGGVSISKCISTYVRFVHALPNSQLVGS